MCMGTGVCMGMKMRVRWGKVFSGTVAGKKKQYPARHRQELYFLRSNPPRMLSLSLLVFVLVSSTVGVVANELAGVNVDVLYSAPLWLPPRIGQDGEVYCDCNVGKFNNMLITCKVCAAVAYGLNRRLLLLPWCEQENTDAIRVRRVCFKVDTIFDLQ